MLRSLRRHQRAQSQGHRSHHRLPGWERLRKRHRSTIWGKCRAKGWSANGLSRAFRHHLDLNCTLLLFRLLLPLLSASSLSSSSSSHSGQGKSHVQHVILFSVFFLWRGGEGRTWNRICMQWWQKIIILSFKTKRSSELMERILSIGQRRVWPCFGGEYTESLPRLEIQTVFVPKLDACPFALEITPLPICVHLKSLDCLELTETDYINLHRLRRQTDTTHTKSAVETYIELELTQSLWVWMGVRLNELTTEKNLHNSSDLFCGNPRKTRRSNHLAFVKSRSHTKRPTVAASLMLIACLISRRDNSTLILFSLCWPTVTVHQGQGHRYEHGHICHA